MFTLDFLNQVANGLEKDSMYVALFIPTSLPPLFVLLLTVFKSKCENY